jgi:hypothetical protein
VPSAQHACFTWEYLEIAMDEFDIRAALHKLGLTQIKAADILGVSHRAMRYYVSGRAGYQSRLKGCCGCWPAARSRLWTWWRSDFPEAKQR